MTKKDTIAALMLVAISGCGGGAASGGGEGTTAARSPSQPASASQFVAAIDAALAAHPDARIFEVEIDDSHHVGFLEVEFFSGETAQEIFFDPGTMEAIDDRPEPIDPADAEVHVAVRARLEAGEGNVRSVLESGAMNSHAIETVQEVELTMLEGHYVVAVEVLRDGARTELFHALDGRYLGGRDEALTALAQPATPTP